VTLLALFEPHGDFDAGLIDVQRQIYLSSKQRLLDHLQVKQEQLSQVNEKEASLVNALNQNNYLVGMYEERLNRLKQVQDIVSREEYSNAENDWKVVRSDLLITQNQLEESRAACQQVLEEIGLLKEEERNSLLAELAEKLRDQLYLQANVEQSSFVTERQQIVAPVEGYINNLLIHTVGGVVTPAEKLISVVPSDTPLVIKALVESKDSGFVESGMAASIKIDTFSFQKYGIIDGLVDKVSKDSLEDERLGLVYDVYVDPQQLSIMVEGQEMPITTGMGVTVEIKTGMRRIIEFFIYPMIKYLDEGMSVR